MMKSMTGYGFAEQNFIDFTISAEIRSLNHRFLDIFTRLPREFNRLDIPIRKNLRKYFSRGRIEVCISMEYANSNLQALEVDHNLAKQYHRCLNDLQKTLGIEDKICLQDILRYPDIVKIKESISEEDIWPKLKGVMDIAIDKIQEMRKLEGSLICEDIQARLASISGHLMTINERIPVALNEYRSNLQDRLKEFFHIKVSDERLEQEMILHVEKTDVTEEAVRIDIHLSQMKEMLNYEGPIGRKMDFIIQEIYRETNTLGAKTLDSIITENVVDIKHELEKIREQVQNIE